MTSAAGRKNPLTFPFRPPPPPPYWLSTEGRNVIGGAAVLSAGVYFGGYTLLHTVLLDRYQSVVQLYKHGFPTPLTSEVIQRCRETVREMNVKLKNEEMTKFFTVFGMDMFTAGSTKFRTGSIIGVPRCFTYKSVDDIEKQDIVVENKHVEWGSDGGLMLQDSLIFSERAQKFAIAREVATADTHLPYFHGGLGSGAILNYCFITRYINEKFYGLARPKSFRLLVYTFVGTFTFGLWATITDLVTKYYENYADELAGRTNLDYARGGVEFYAKVLERNMALRSLMGPSGEKRYTLYGNDVEFIRQKHVPFSKRKEHLESIAVELSGNNQTSTESKFD